MRIFLKTRSRKCILELDSNLAFAAKCLKIYNFTAFTAFLEKSTIFTTFPARWLPCNIYINHWPFYQMLWKRQSKTAFTPLFNTSKKVIKVSYWETELRPLGDEEDNHVFGPTEIKPFFANAPFRSSSEKAFRRFHGKPKWNNGKKRDNYVSRKYLL